MKWLGIGVGVAVLAGLGYLGYRKLQEEDAAMDAYHEETMEYLRNVEREIHEDMQKARDESDALFEETMRHPCNAQERDVNLS